MFDCPPSDIEQVYWKYTRNDIKVKLRLYLAERQAHVVQDFQNLAIIAGKLFGSSKGGSSRESVEAVEPKTADEMTAAFNSVFGI